MKSVNEGIAAGSSGVLPIAKAVALKARTIMTKEVMVLRSEQSLAEAIEVLMNGKLSSAPVLDAEGKLVGVLSELDCMRAIVETSFHQDGGSRSVDQLMNREIFSVDPDADVNTIAHLFISQRIRQVPVLEHGELMGLITRTDVLRAIRPLVS